MPPTLPRPVVVQRCKRADVDLVLRDDGAVWPPVDRNSPVILRISHRTMPAVDDWAAPSQLVPLALAASLSEPCVPGLGPAPSRPNATPSGGLAVSAGANMKAVQRMLGHASAAMALDVYSGPFDDDLDGLVDRMDAASARPRADSLRTEAKVADLTERRTGR